METRRGAVRRKRRPRPTPRWIKEGQEMDEMAQRRALLILSVLSGQVTVTDAIDQAGISRGTYYKLEEKALKAMVSAMLPGADETGQSEAMTAAKRIEELEAKLTQMEKEKRRHERLENVVAKIVGSGPMTMGVGRKRILPMPSPGSSPVSASTRTKGGGVEP
jgi:hypothetical protein